MRNYDVKIAVLDGAFITPRHSGEFATQWRVAFLAGEILNITALFPLEFEGMPKERDAE